MTGKTMKKRATSSKKSKKESDKDEESIDADEFSRLLQDRVFVDYFNVFLSLPIFSQRAIYIYGDMDFEFDPPITRTKYVLDKSKLIKWLLTERVPLFLKSELYVEYLLCKELLTTRLFFSSSARKLEYGEFRHREDLMLLEETVGHVVGMSRFRKYLEGCPGEQVFRFWVDAERLKRISKWDLESRWLAFREMQIKYFKADALSSVHKSEAWEVFSEGTCLYGEQPFEPGPPAFEPPEDLQDTLSASALEQFVTQTVERPAEARIDDAPFCELQALVLAVIKDYWLQKYLLHCRAVQIKQQRALGVVDKGIAIRSVADIGVIKDVKNIDKALTLLQGANDNSAQRVTKKKGRLSWNAMFPENKVDDTYLIPSDEVITLHNDGSVTMELVQSEEFEKMLQRYLSGSSDEEAPSYASQLNTPLESVGSSRKSPVLLPGVSSTSKPSSANKPPPRRQSIDLMKRIALAEARKQKPNAKRSTKTKLDLFEQLLNLHMAQGKEQTTTIRPQSCPIQTLPHATKQGTGGKIKKKKQAVTTTKPEQDRDIFRKQIVEDEGTSLPTISEHEALVSSAPASVSYARGYTGTVLTKPQHKYKNLCEGYYRYDHLDYVLAIAADRLAGTPFQNFLLQKKYSSYDWQILNFWHTIQVYLATRPGHGVSVGDYLRFRRAKTLLMRYLSGSGDRQVKCLPPGLHKLLNQVIPEGGGDDLLRDAQDLICEYVRHVWKRYRKYDRNLFLENVLIAKKRRGSAYRESPRVGSVPPYFDRQSRLPSLVPPASPDKAAGEDTSTPANDAESGDTEDTLPGIIAERRATRALQLTVDMSDFYEDGLPMKELAINEIDFNIDSPYGSLDVPPPVSYIRPDLEMEMEHQRKLARMRTARLAALEQEQETASRRVQLVVEDDTPVYMKPIKRGGQVHHRSMRPSRFNDVMKDPIQMEFFRRYLVHMSGDTPILFYSAVEDLKKTKEPKIRQQKIHQITRKYFKSQGIKALECSADVIKEIPKMDKVTTAMLISAQSCVQRSLEENRFGPYLETFPEDNHPNVMSTMRLLTDGGKRTWGKKRTRSLWVSFINTVARFRRGILDIDTCSLFEEFLRVKCKDEIEKQKATGQTWNQGMPVKKVIRGKLIDVTKLTCDLRFLAEAERYRSMSDDAAAAAKEGSYSRHDQSTLELKAKMIIECFVDSDLPPKLQINATQEVAEDILEMFSNNMIERGLFHYATIALFTILLYYWKKFQKFRFIRMIERFEKHQVGVDSDEEEEKHDSVPDYINMSSLKTKRTFAQHGEDDHPRILFSLGHGPRLLIPCSKEHHRRTTVFQIGRNSVFYAGDVEGAEVPPPPLLSPSFLAGMSPSQHSMHRRGSSGVRGLRMNIAGHLGQFRKARKMSMDTLHPLDALEEGRHFVPGGRRESALAERHHHAKSGKGGRKKSHHIVLPPITLKVPHH